MRKYETIFVLDSLLKSEEIDAIIGKYERFISANGGQIETVDRWGKKRLAYEIKKRQYGFYVFIRFDGPPTIIKPLEREYRLNESLLRYKTLLMDKVALAALAARTAAMPRPAVDSPEAKPAPVEESVPAVVDSMPADETGLPEAEASEIEPAAADDVEPTPAEI